MISVIVPAYNSSEYIRKCIQSILDQEYKDYELLLIDDGSLDSTPNICDEYATRDNRIRSFHRPHRGLVATRRFGIEVAKGDYICWVDSDDWVEPTYLGNFDKLQQNNNVDAVVSGLFYDIADFSRKERGSIPPGIYNAISILGEALYAGSFYKYGVVPNLVAKFFKTTILRQAIDMVDDAITIGEDAAISYTALRFCNKICIADICDYHYVHHKGSMTMQPASDEKNKINILIDCLKQNIGKSFPEFNSSIKMYEKFLKFTRTDELLIEKNGKVLLPFGGFIKGESIILYGAGGTGQTIYKNITETGSLNVLAWVDKGYEKYNMEGLGVSSPSCIKEIISRHSAKIVIAVAYEDVASQIKNELLSQNISEDSIVWLSNKFLDCR